MKLAMHVSLSRWVWEARIQKLGAVSSNSRILCSQKILTLAHSSAVVWPLSSWFPLSREGCIVITQNSPRYYPGIQLVSEISQPRLPGRQRAPAVVPLGWPQILTLFFLPGNEPAVDGIAPFHWGPLHGCFPQYLSRSNASVQSSWDHH